MIDIESVDEAFKIGCGRYIQKQGALEEVPAEVERLGKHAFVFFGEEAKQVAGDKVCDLLQPAGLFTASETYTGAVCNEGAEELIDKAKNAGCDVVVGVGGGRIMDMAKIVANELKLPVVEVPTSIATCASYYALSVVYTKDYRYVGCARFENEPNAIVVDMDVIKNAPARLLASGALDSLAQAIEIPHGSGSLKFGEGPLQRYCAYNYAKTNYDVYLAETKKAFDDTNNHVVTDELNDITLLNIVLTGIVAAITNNYRHTALAHRFYNALRYAYGPKVCDWLHGELVAIGLRMQCLFNGFPEQEKIVSNLMREMDMPMTLADLGVSPTDAEFRDFKDFIIDSPFVEDSTLNKFEETFQITVK